MKEEFLKTALYKITRLFILSLAMIIITGPALSASAKQSRIAIVPFTINAEKDLTFLREGIYSMLTSRLSWEGKVAVIGREKTGKALENISGPIDEKLAQKIGANLNVDYVLYGSLTVFGNSVSIDSKIVDISGTQPPLSFYNQSQGMGEVIPRINLFAEEISEKVFGRKIAVSQLPEKKVRETPSIYIHPERMLTGEFVEPDEAGGGRSPFVMTGRSDATPGFWKSKNFRMQIRGLALGDVDGDGKTETIMISSQSVHIYRSESGRFLKIKEIAGEKYHKYVAVDVADIQKNEIAEIFVTCLNTNSKRLESFVLEWNGNDFEYIAKNENLYYRALFHPERGHLILGQKRGISDLFLPGVYELAWIGGRYELQNRVSLPKDTNVFSFVIGDVMNNGNEMVVLFDEEDRLRIFTHAGEREWKSEDRFGGSENYLDTPESEDRVYLPHRIFVTDLNQDGKTEVVVVKNRSLSSRLFKRYRRYSGGQIKSLSWDGLGLAENWHTRKVSGYFSDYAIGDIDNDGDLELVAAIVSRRDVLGQKAKSTIITYDLTPLKED